MRSLAGRLDKLEALFGQRGCVCVTCPKVRVSIARYPGAEAMPHSGHDFMCPAHGRVEPNLHVICHQYTLAPTGVSASQGTP